MMKPIPTATRPCEVLCPIEFPTREGDAYCFITLDVFSEFLVQTGTEISNDIAHVLKHIELLMEHKDFSKRKHRTFTLVLHKHELHQSKIEAIIKPHWGTLVVSDSYLSEKVVPVIEALYESMAKKFKEMVALLKTKSFFSLLLANPKGL